MRGGTRAQVQESENAWVGCRRRATMPGRERVVDKEKGPGSRLPHRLRIRAVLVTKAAAAVDVSADTMVPLIVVDDAAGTGRFPVVARVVPFAGAGTLVTNVMVVTLVPFRVTAVSTTTEVDCGCSEV